MWNRKKKNAGTPKQKAEAALKRVLHPLIRDIRDSALPCILSAYMGCDPSDEMECGHFIPSQHQATTYHPWNLNRESHGCNNAHVSAMNPDKGYPYGLAIDKKYGRGTARFLWDISHPKHEKGKIPKDDGWTEDELVTLKEAAKRGYQVYELIYFQLRPSHKPNYIP